MSRSIGLLLGLLALFTLPACGGNSEGGGGNGGSGGSGGSGGTGGSGDGDLGLPPTPDLLGSAPGTFTVSIGPITINSNQEITKCTTFRMPNTNDIDIVELSATLAKGSHHLILYRSNATTESTTPTDCEPFEGVTTGEVPIFIAESAYSDLKMPPSVSWHFTANQMVKLEAHYINATANTLQGLGTIVLTPGASGTSYQAADIMFCGSMAALSPPLGIPANKSNVTLPPGFYAGGGATNFQAINVFAFTSHEHHLGSGVTISKSTSASDPGTQLFSNPNWDNPPLTRVPDTSLLTFAPGEGLRWQCSYDSLDAVPQPTSTTYFGLGALTNEMCFIWAYYYPSVGHFISNECWQ